MRKKTNQELGRLSAEEFRKEEKSPVLVVLDNVRSLHNVGSVFRTADSFRVKSLYLCGITGKPPDREIRKTALGATESVNWKYFPSALQALKELKEEGYLLCAIEQAEGAVRLDQFIPPAGRQIALVFGNEVNGVEQELVDFCDTVIEIPQLGTKHSLNIAVSAGIVIWDLMVKLACLKEEK